MNILIFYLISVFAFVVYGIIICFLSNKVLNLEKKINLKNNVLINDETKFVDDCKEIKEENSSVVSSWKDLEDEEARKECLYAGFKGYYEESLISEELSSQMSKQEKAYRKYCIENNEYDFEELSEDEKGLVEDIAQVYYEEVYIKKHNKNNNKYTLDESFYKLSINKQNKYMNQAIKQLITLELTDPELIEDLTEKQIQERRIWLSTNSFDIKKLELSEYYAVVHTINEKLKKKGKIKSKDYYSSPRFKLEILQKCLLLISIFSIGIYWVLSSINLISSFVGTLLLVLFTISFISTLIAYSNIKKYCIVCGRKAHKEIHQDFLVYKCLNCSNEWNIRRTKITEE